MEVYKGASQKREYKNLPDPIKDPEGFNSYLRINNEIVHEEKDWIIIENSYIDSQLVAFCKHPVRNFAEYSAMWPASEGGLGKIVSFLSIFEKYNGKHIYINADGEKSVPNRFHIHIKL